MIRFVDRAYRRLFTSGDGKVVLQHLARTHGAWRRSAMVAGDPQMTAYFLGQHDVVLAILRRAGHRERDLPELVAGIDCPETENEHG